MDALANLSVIDFTTHIATAQEPLVGGGSTAALSGSISASLIGLVGKISMAGLEEDEKAKLCAMMEDAESIRLALVEQVSRDAYSFCDVMSAFKLPKQTEEEKTLRSMKIQEGYKHAIAVPFETALMSMRLFPYIEFLFTHGNKNAETDVLTAAMCAKTSVLSAIYNVKINLLSIKDTQYLSEKTAQAEEVSQKAIAYEKKILNMSSLLPSAAI